MIILVFAGMFVAGGGLVLKSNLGFGLGIVMIVVGAIGTVSGM